MRVIVHFGAHKTASTHLQHNLEINREVLERKKIAYLNFNQSRELRYEAIQLRHHIADPAFDSEKSSQRIKSLIEKEIKGYRAAIISYEGILGDMNHAAYSDIYPHAETIIEVYKKIFEDHEVTPVFSSRNYDSFLRSTYKFKLKVGPYRLDKKKKFTLTLNEYLRDKALTDYRWTEIVNGLNRAFSRDVNFYTHEDYKKDWKAIVVSIMELTKQFIDPSELHFDPKKKNVSGSKENLDFYYTLNWLYHKTPNFKNKEKRYKRLKNKYLKYSGNTVLSRFLLSHQKQQVAPLYDLEAYRKEARALKQEFGILNPQKQPFV